MKFKVFEDLNSFQLFLNLISKRQNKQTIPLNGSLLDVQLIWHYFHRLTLKRSSTNKGKRLLSTGDNDYQHLTSDLKAKQELTNLAS